MINVCTPMVVAVVAVATPSTGAASVRTGASFTLVTVRKAVSVPVLNAVSPPTAPVWERSARPPLVPLVVAESGPRPAARQKERRRSRAAAR